MEYEFVGFLEKARCAFAACRSPNNSQFKASSEAAIPTESPVTVCRDRIESRMITHFLAPSEKGEAPCPSGNVAVSTIRPNCPEMLEWGETERRF